MNNLKINTILILLCLSTTLFAQDLQPVKDTAAFRKKLVEMNLKINTIEAAFNQEQFLSVMSEKIISKGKFYFKKENKLRWEYSEPFEYMIVIDGKKMQIKDEEKTKVYDIESNKMFKEINTMMVGMVKGTILDSKEFTFTYFENDKRYSVKLIPRQKQMAEFIKSIDIFLNKVDFSVDEIILTDPTGDYTKIVFNSKKLNSMIDDSRFTVK